MNSNFKRYTYLTITILVISFIFYNSTRNGIESANTSDGLLIFFNNILAKLNLDFTISSLFLRKFAHFVEFFLLGTLITSTFNSFTHDFFKNLGFVLFLCLLIPVLDETIQIFSVGRSSQVSDVLLDFSGCFTGICLNFIFVKAKKSRKPRRYF